MKGVKRLYSAYLDAFPAVYAFLAGFVFFEPSLAEYAFLLALPGLALRTSRNRRTWILAALLFIPTAASAIYARFAFGNLNLRFLAIEAYLFGFFLVARGGSRGLPAGLSESPGPGLEPVFRAMAAASFAGILAGLYAYAVGGDPAGIRLVYSQRLYGFFKDTNVFASYMLVPFFHYARRFFDAPKHRESLPHAAVSAVLSAGILLTFSRAAWLVYALGLAWLLVRTLVRGDRSRRIRSAVLGAVLALAAALLLSGAVKVGSLDISSILRSRMGLVSYDTKRFDAQRRAFDMLRESTVFGIGPGLYEDRSDLSAHNLYLRILGERGVLGAAGFLAFAALTALGLRGRRTDPVLILALAAFLVESFFIDTLHWRHLWLVLVLVSRPEEAWNPGRDRMDRIKIG